MTGEQRIDLERMAALGSIARGLAHEMNTPLAAIVSNNDTIETALRRIRTRLDPPGGQVGEAVLVEVRELLRIAEDSLGTSRLAAGRLRGFVVNLRDHSRIDGDAPEKVDIREPIETALALLAHELRSRIAVVKEFGETGPVECHRAQLSQVFVNILMNAAQAIQGPGEIRIRTRNDNNTVRVAISDNGPGIPPEILTRIFEPGFTTRKANAGMGLGLAICREIVEAHHGSIEVQSSAGGGSTFTITLPIASERTTNG